MKRINSNKAQNLTELALILGVVSLAFIGMEVYLKRGFQGKVRDFTDYVMGSAQRESVANPEEIKGWTKTFYRASKTDIWFKDGEKRSEITDDHARERTHSEYTHVTGPVSTGP